MMSYRLSPRAGSVFAAAIVGACAGAAYHHETARLDPRPVDALVGARVRGAPLATGSGTSAPMRRTSDGWTVHGADEPFQLGTAIATDAAGRVHVAGLSSAGRRRGEAAAGAAGGSGAASGLGLAATVARLLPDGGYAWSRTCTASGALGEPRLAVAPDGEVAVALTFQGHLDCGAGSVAAAGGDDDLDGVVLRLDKAGRLLWWKIVSDIGAQVVASVAFDPWGGLVIAGSFEGTVDLGGPPLTAHGERDALLARLGPDGDLVWQKRLGTTGASHGVDVDVAPSGRIALLVRADAPLDLGHGELSCARTCAFVGAFDLGGQPIWSRRLGGTGDVFAEDLAALAGDRVVVAGAFTGAADLGAGLLTSAGSTDVFVVKLGPTGEALWSVRFGDAAEQTASQVAGGPGGRVALTGRFDGALDLGQGALRSGGGDLFVAKMSATGRPIWSLRADPALSEGLAITMDSGGQVLATGPTPRAGGGRVGLGPGFVAPFGPRRFEDRAHLSAPGGADLFAARLEP